MDWMNQIGGLLQRYSDPNRTQGGVEDDFDQVAQHAPRGAVSEGLAESFRSQATPPFPQMLTQLFNNSAPDQKATILNMLMGAVGSGALSSVLGRFGGAAGLGGLLGGGGQQAITPDQAAQIPADAVQDLAQQAERKDSSIIEQISDFYSQQPGVVKTLGAAALTVALAHLGKKHKLL